jgi:hypothetical protein
MSNVSNSYHVRGKVEIQIDNSIDMDSTVLKTFTANSIKTAFASTLYSGIYTGLGIAKIETSKGEMVISDSSSLTSPKKRVVWGRMVLNIIKESYSYSV